MNGEPQDEEGKRPRVIIDPALGLELDRARTLGGGVKSMCVGIPAHDEAATITGAVEAAFAGLAALGLPGSVLVAASGCTDETARLAQDAGARVLEAPLGKGAAVRTLVDHFEEESLCLLDADLEYFGREPLVTTLGRPLVEGIADAVLADLHWRPIYPQLWLHGFYAPLAGVLFPESLAALGHTPWTGQRAARRALWEGLELPADFTVDLAVNLQWIATGHRVVSLPTDDWVNPQRPKPDLMRQELEVVLDAAERAGRLRGDRAVFVGWFELTHARMATYRPGVDDPTRFEQALILGATDDLRAALAR